MCSLMGLDSGEYQTRLLSLYRGADDFARLVALEILQNHQKSGEEGGRIINLYEQQKKRECGGAGIAGDTERVRGSGAE